MVAAVYEPHKPRPSPISPVMSPHSPSVVDNRVFAWAVGPSISLRRFAVVLLPWYGAAIAICWFDGTLALGTHVGLWQDVVWLALLVLLPAIVLAVRLVLQRFEDVLQQLAHIVRPPGRLSATPHSPIPSLADDAGAMRAFVLGVSPLGRRAHGATLGFFAALVFVFQVAIPLLMPPITRSWALWPQEYPISFVFGIVWAAFYWVVVIGNVAWYALSIAWLVFAQMRRYVREGRLIVPVVPDPAGGLAVLGRLSFSLSLLASAGPVLIVAWLFAFGADLSLVLGAVVYVLALAGVFFLPLIPVHRAMKGARDSEVSRVAALFREAHARLPHNTSERDARAAKDSLEKTVQLLGDLDALYKRAEAAHVWPFDARTLTQFFTLVILPLMLFVLQVLSEGWIAESAREFVR